MRYMNLVPMAALALCLAVMSLQALGQETSQKPNADAENMLGEWCGKIDLYAYTWVHTINGDGTFSTYFESYPNPNTSDEPYWHFGQWSLEDGHYVEIVTSEQTVGEDKRPKFPPYIHQYQIAVLTAEKRQLYYPEWDVTFVSTRHCGPLLG